MMSENKNTKIIIVFVVIIILILVINIFLWFNYQQKINFSKQLISQQAEDDVSDLTPDISLPSKVVDEDQVVFDEVDQILIDYIDSLSFDVSLEGEKKAADQLLASSDDIVADLGKLAVSSNRNIRRNAYLALDLLLRTNRNRQASILPIFKKGLIDPDIGIRVKVASTVVYFRDKDGLPVLIEGLDNKYKGIVVFSEPPLDILEHCFITLIQYTDQDFGYDRVKWQQWWLINKDQLQWDEKREEFKTS